MTASTRRAVLGALAALATVSAMASPALSFETAAPLEVVGADIGGGSLLRLTRVPGADRRPVFLICGDGAQGAGASRLATECATAGFAAVELHGAPWSPEAIDRSLDWLDQRPGVTIDPFRTMAGAEGAWASQALTLADRARADGRRRIAGVVGLNGRYGPGAVEMARRVTRPYDSGERGAGILLLGHFDQAADTLALAEALMKAQAPFQLQILAEDAAAQASRSRRALALARGFVGDGAAPPLRT